MAVSASLHHAVLLLLILGQMSHDLCFIGAFAELRKVTVSFVLSVCLSVHMEQLACLWAGFRNV